MAGMRTPPSIGSLRAVALYAVELAQRLEAVGGAGDIAVLVAARRLEAEIELAEERAKARMKETR